MKTQNAALLIMDMQLSILQNLPEKELLINNVINAINTARANSMPVIYVVVGFREGAPEISMNNKSFSAARERFSGIKMADFAKIDPAIQPLPNDIIVTKRRVSAFTGSDLEVILRAQSIQHLVLTGIATGGVVLSTLREAADKDYRLTVLSDCCADVDPEVHQVLTTKIFPRQAEVIALDQWQNQ